MTNMLQDETVPNSPDYLSTLLNLGQLLNSTLELKQVLDTAIDQVISFVGAERGFILLVEVETGRVWGEALRQIEKQALEDTLSGRDETNRAEISRTLVESVLDTRQSVLTHNAMEDPRYASRQSVQLANLRSVMCVPLLAQSHLLGVLYLDNRVKSGMFTDRHLSMLTAFANQASVAIENARLYDNLRRSLEERLKLQDDLHRQETQRLALEEAGRLKSDFIGFVAHELRNPLTTIRGYVQTLMNDEDSTLTEEEKAEFYEAIEADSDRLLEMINELLDVSRLEAGRPLSLSLSVFDICELVQKQIRRHRFYKFATNNHQIIHDLTQQQSIMLHADEEKINQIVANLLSNAYKYSPAGGEINVTVALEGEHGLLISVSDSGVGMSQDQIARLFHQYERIDREDIANIPGTGLGLYLVKNLVDLHGGWIDCESQPGQGALFTVHLPLRQIGQHPE